jgi:hypothetical protein
LDELENVLKQTNIEEYAVMKANALQMQTKLQSGYYMKQALNRALNMFPKK